MAVVWEAADLGTFGVSLPAPGLGNQQGSCCGLDPVPIPLIYGDCGKKIFVRSYK